ESDAEPASDDLTVATSVLRPPWVSRTTIVNTRASPSLRVPTGHTTLPPDGAHPVARTNTAPGGRASVTATSCAAKPRVLVTVRVYVTSEPATAVAGATFVIARKETVSNALSVLSPPLADVARALFW